MSKKGDIVTLEIADLAFDGKSVANHEDGKVVFVNGGLPGETIEAEIVQSKPRYDRAIVKSILKYAPERIDARCVHFGYCGGCTWQDLDYTRQLYFKQKQVADCLAHIGGLQDVEIKDIVGSDEQFFYRNKMEFSFHVTPDEGFTLGLHHRGRFDAIFDLQECHLESEESNRLVAFTREYVKRESLPVYDVLRHEGYLRFLMIRRAVNTGQLMVNLVTNYGDFPDFEKLVAEMREAVPEVTTIVHNQNGQKSNIATGEVENILFGPGYIEEELMGRRFRIRANSFFQTNSRQAETLYGIGFDMLQAEKTDRVLDLYCGTGTIGILLAGDVAEVVGVELVSDAVTAAGENATLNGVENISFYEGNVKDFLKDNPAAAENFEAVIIDPPRSGLHPKALKQLIALKPAKLLYISCNPATFARDAKELVKAGYSLPAVQPVDMFPHTMHIELVGRFYSD